jgi:hypothetical protein
MHINTSKMYFQISNMYCPSMGRVHLPYGIGAFPTIFGSILFGHGIFRQILIRRHTQSLRRDRLCCTTDCIFSKCLGPIASLDWAFLADSASESIVQHLTAN